MANVKREAGFGIGIPIRPQLDEKSSVEVLKKLSKLKASWAEVSKGSKISLKEIQEMSAFASDFGKKLSKATQTSYKRISELGDALQTAMEKADNLQDALKNAQTPEQKKELTEQLGTVSSSVLDLKKQIDDFGKSNSKSRKELDRVVKRQQDYQKKLGDLGKYDAKDALKDFFQSIGSGAKAGGLKGALSGAGRAAVGGVQGGLARTAVAGGAGTAGATGVGAGAGALASGIGKAAGAIGLLAAAIGALWNFIKAASDHQAKLNKALLDGTGFVNDFTTDTKAYRKAVDDIREGTQDASASLLRYGANSETAAKAINAFAKESTGSLIKTRDTMMSLGRGDVAAGVEQFSRNAIVYGKALGMESTEVAGMMGKFVSEAGYGAEQVQGLMGNVVKAAATANMPMTKFMGIFKSVLPDVELYQNRLEELTGTIKLLSKTMSPKDVKNFMDAFSKGFQGMDFRQRLKTTLVAGTGYVSSALGKDFDMKAKAMAQNFEKYATPDMGSFADAMKGGEASMAKFISKAQSNAAKKGAEISGTQIGDAMKLAANEAARRKGGPLNVATAMRGAGVYSTYKILNKFGQTLTTGFDGLSEHVMKQLGISEQQYDALRTTSQSLKLQRTQLQQYGNTTSKSMNKSLRETIALRKGIKASDVTQKDMQNVTDEDLFQAAEMSNALKEGQQTAEDLAQEQTSAVTSISEKIDNVIAFLLEKIYRVLTPVLKILDDIYQTIVNWISGTPEDAKAMQRMANSIEEMKGSFEGKTTSKESFGFVAEMMKKQALAGGTPDMMASTFKQMVDASSFGGADKLDALIAEIKKGPAEDVGKKLMGLLTKEGAQVTDRVQKKAMDKVASEAAMRREGTDVKKTYRTVADKKAAQEAGDLETNLEEIGKTAAAAVGKAQERAAEAPVRMGTTQVMMNAGIKEPSADSKHAADATKSVQQSVDDQAKVQQTQGDDLYDGINDVAGVLKKGIRVETQTMANGWKGSLKSATLDAFRVALLEFAILEARMAEDDELKSALVKQGAGLSGKEKGLADVIPGFNVSGSWEDYINRKVLGTRQMGGPIPDTGLYKLHRGEYVLPPGATAGGGKGGGGPITVYMTVNGTNLSPDQLKGVVYEAMDEVARRH